MVASKIEANLAQLRQEVNNCEKALMKLITVKKNMTRNLPNSITEQSKNNPQTPQTNIAIIGMASLFPESKNLQEYWEKIIQKVDCITDVPPSRWRIEDYYDPDPKAPDKTYCKRGGFIPDIDFNPLDFGLPPNLLEVTDISQLLGLVVAKAAMLDAGYGESRQFNRDRTGVVLGVALARQLGIPLGARLQYPIWEKVLLSSGLSAEDSQKIVAKIKSAYVQWDENALPGMLANVIAGRIANRLDLGGMNCVVDAACASSLGALKMCISELLEHRADMMLTGGVDTDNSILAYMGFSKTPAVSPGENVKPFDIDSQGMMLGEGVGMLVLKRLEDAQRDKDRIYAVIKGIGASSDGRYKSIYAPYVGGQVKAFERAYLDARISPTDVRLVEAHGTGTMVGDPTEVESMKQVFGENELQKPPKQYIALGSVKSQIGHTKAAAGAASLIKTALALHHKVLPPTINITQPHPKLDIENSPFYLNTETRPWISQPNQPRRAGVSAFGFGGTNYHVVLEEYTHEHDHAYRLHNIYQIVILSAPTPEDLVLRCQEVEQQLQSEESEKYYTELIAAAQSPEIAVNNARIGFVAHSIAQTGEFLRICTEWLQKKPADATSWEHPQGIYYRRTGIETTGKVVALFSGQGTQYLDMGKELTINFPNWRQTYIRMDQLLCEDGLDPVSDVVFPKPVFDASLKNSQLAKLQLTEYAQPALAVFSSSLYKILQQAGFKADFLAGHSFGELTALWAGGVLHESDYLFLAKARGQAMVTPRNPEFDAGGMLAVKGDVNQVVEIIQNFPQVAIANRNSPHQVVLAGKQQEMLRVEQELKAKGFTTVMLGVSAAFHTPLVAHAQKPFAEALKKVSFQEPIIPVYSNVTGDRYPHEPQAIAQILKEQMRNQVLFQQQIENIYAAGGYCFVEFGPRSVLTNLVKETLSGKPHIAVALNAHHRQDSDRCLRDAVVQLQVAGLPLKNLDPYQIPLEIPVVTPEKNKSKNLLTMQLNSSNLTHKVEEAFAQVLKNGDRVNLPPVTQPITLESSLAVNGKDSHHNYDQTTLVNGGGREDNHELVKVNLPSPQDMGNMGNIDNLDNFFVDFNHQQKAILQVHEQSLQNQTEYNRASFQLIQQQDELWKNIQLTPDQRQEQQIIISSSEENIIQFHEYQSDTLRIHEQYLTCEQEFIEQYFQLVTSNPHHLLESSVSSYYSRKPVKEPAKELSRKPAKESLKEPSTPKLVNVTEIIEDSSTSPIEITTLSQDLLNIVSDKTGYPMEMLDLSMNIESDLGIDSIKRVEILGSLLELHPHLPKPNPEELAQLKTLGEIADYIRRLFGESEEQREQGSRGAGEQGEESQLSLTVSADLSLILFSVVSDKTGYPVEMLDLSMNIESDLGIDSIKRVEILGGLIELYPDLPKPSPEELAQLNTLGEILEFMRQRSTDSTNLLTTTPEIETPESQLQEEIFYSPVRLKQLPEPDILEWSLQENQIVLVTDDGSPTTEKLVTALLNLGWKTVLLSFPGFQSTFSTGIPQVLLSDWSEESLAATLQSIVSNYGAIAAFIHLHPDTQNQDSHQVHYWETDKIILRQIFLIAKHIAKHPQKPVCFFNILRLDGKLGCGQSHNFGVIGGGLFGLTKSLNLEWANTFCRSVDLSPEIDAETSVKYILAELYDPNRLIREVGYTKDARFTLVAEPANFPLLPAPCSPTSADTFLVTGGGKGITAKCVIKLAQEYHCKFILCGRSSTEPEPVWAEGCEQESQLKQLIMQDFQAKGEKPTPVMVEKKFRAISAQREIQRTLKAIASVGGQAEYISVDVTDRIMLAEKLAIASERFGAITGIIHGAGNLADKLIEKKTLQDFETVYSAKVKGLENVIESVPPDQLQYLILFSSVVGFYGNAGQTDYAIANEILNKSAHLFKQFHPNCRVISINWGPWDDGMVSPELKKTFVENGIDLIPTEVGTQMLVNQLSKTSENNLQIVIGSPLTESPQDLTNELITYQIRRQLKLTANPFVYDHIISQRPVLPATCGLSWMANACEQIYPGFKICSILNFKILKGIVFDDNLVKEYLLDLQEIAHVNNEEIHFYARISSTTPTGKIRYHFSADLILKRTIPTIPRYEFLNSHQDETFLDLQNGFYQNGSSSLFHGPMFQGVKSVLNASPNKLTIACYLEKLTEEQQGQFPVQTFNPYIADVQIHSLWICTQHFHQVRCLPAEISRFEQFAMIPFNQTFYVTCEIKSKTEANIVADVIVYNNRGEIYNQMFDAKGTILTKEI